MTSLVADALPWRRLARLRQAPGEAAVTIMLWLAAAVCLLRAAIFSWRFFTPQAFFDLWQWVDDYQRWTAGTYTFHDLIKLHYNDAHRIATTRLLLLADSIFFSMEGRLPGVVNFALLMLLGSLIWRMVRRDGMAHQRSAPLIFWIALSCSVCQVENLIFPFQVQFAIVCCLACGCVLLLSKAAECTGRGAAWRALAAGVLGVAAIFSMASGVLLAPALWLLLALRRARILVWAIFLPFSVAGIVLYYHHHPQAPPPALLNARLALVRIVFIGNFIASGLTGFPAVATQVGWAALAVLAVVAGYFLRRGPLAGRALASGEAALLVTASFVLVCGIAATLTGRLDLGAGAALVSRYATMSLLFAAALLGLLWRRAAAPDTPRWIGSVAMPVISLVVLGIMNVPFYDRSADGLHRAVLSNDGLLANNLAMEGPAPELFGGTVDDIRADTVFLHREHLNMFSAAERPPARLLAAAARTDAARLPVCRGFVDYAYAIDETGFLLRGWAADPAGKMPAPWVAALDGQGRVLGTSRLLASRPDVADALGTREDLFGFETGGRFTSPAADQEQLRPVRMLALFAGRRPSVCALQNTPTIGPLMISPLAQLSILAAQPLSRAPNAEHFTPWTPSSSGSGRPADRLPAGAGAWAYDPGHDRQASGALHFDIVPDPQAGAIAIPFATIGYSTPDRHLILRMADGTVFETPFFGLYDRPAWRAVVLPGAIVERHHGLVAVDVQATETSWLVIGPPLRAALRPHWSQIF